MNRNNKIISIAILALGLGCMPQAQGMGYFEAAYNGARSWGQKAVNSALSVKDQAIARMAAIVNHIVPQKPKKSVNSEVGINRINTIINHLQPDQPNAALRRAKILIGHLAPQEDVNILVPEACGGLDEKFNEMDQSLRNYLNMYHDLENRYDSAIKQLLANEIGNEEVFDANNNKIGIIYFYKLEIGKIFTIVVTRLVNNEGKTIGFCIGETEADPTKGHIAYLLISPTERKNGYGQILLAHNARLLYQIGCIHLHGTASSFDLKQGEDKDTMQPKLESFYGQFGAESLDGNKARLGITIQ